MIAEVDETPEEEPDNTVSNLRAQSSQKDMKHIKEMIERKRRMSKDMNEDQIVKSVVKNAEGFNKHNNQKWIKGQ